MATEEPSLGKRAAKHALSRTIGAYQKNIEGLGGQIVITIFALLITASLHGVAVMFTEASTYITIIGANAAWLLILFVWHLWLAPHELVMEELGGLRETVKNAPVSASPVSAALAMSINPVFIDSATRRMAGDLQQLGEVVRRPRFVNFEEDSQEEYNYANLCSSTHIVWTRPNALQLRRDFRNAVGRVFTANMEHDVEERNTAIADMDKAISSLVPILLGTNET
jgi:hypothetical protein